MTTQQTINEMVDRIVRRFHPEKVILFGSQARGDASPDSDVDLAIIFSGLDVPRRERAVGIRLALRDIPAFMDILVLTQRDYEEQKDLAGTLGHILQSEGKTLYRHEA